MTHVYEDKFKQFDFLHRLADSEYREFFKEIFSNIHDVVGIADKHGNVFYRSENCIDLFGYSETELLNFSAFELIHPDDQEYVIQNFKNLVSGPANFEMKMDLRYRHKNGSFRKLEIIGKNLFHLPFIDGVLLTYRDVTDFLDSMEKHAHSIERYKALIESTGNMVWSVNLDNYGLETFNTFMAEYYKKNLGIDLRIGLTPKDMLPKNRLKFWMDLYNDVIENGSKRVQYPMISSDRILMINLNPIYVNSKMTGISVFVKDETDVITASNQTKEEMEKYLALIENMSDYVSVIDAEDYSYKHFNTAHAAYVKKSFGVDIYIGMDSRSFLPQETDSFWMNAYQSVIKNGSAEFHKYLKSGDLLVHFKLNLLNFGTHKSILVFGEDITNENRYLVNLEKAKSDLIRTNETLNKEFEKAIGALSKLGEIRDPYTAGHQKRVQILACAIAEKLKLTDDQKRNIRLGALVHDIGKIYVPAEILTKPGKISEIEFSLIKSHSEYGYQIVKEIECVPDIYNMILQHHERIDGSGYPKGLQGDEILLESKIIAVADVVEAMSSHRPYRPALGIEEAIKEIKHNRGLKYDSNVVDVCIDLFTKNNFEF